MKTSQPLYTILIGFNYGRDGKRHEAGERNVHLPAKVAHDLLNQNPPVIALQPAASTSSEASEGVK
jgi:hypothetical protein